MNREEHAWLTTTVTKGRQHFHRLTLDDVDLHVLAVCQIDPPLVFVVREIDVPGRTLRQRLTRILMLGHVGSIFLEDLNPVATSVAHVDEPIVGDGDIMNGTPVMLARRRIGVVGGERAVVGALPIGPPVPLVLSRLGIEDDDTPIAITIGDVDLVGVAVDPNARRAA